MNIETITLDEIPTIRKLYEDGTLKAVQNPHMKPIDGLLDRVSLLPGDITKLEVDVIVNAANETLLGGGGVDGAIHRAAGRRLLHECYELGGCDTGDAKITKGYNLPAKHVIHTVGPVYSMGFLGFVGVKKQKKPKLAEQLASCYRKSLELAVENDLKSIAFCAISTGVYGYPIDEATTIALDQARTFLLSDAGASIERVVFTVFSDSDNEIYEELIPHFFPPPGPDDGTQDADGKEADGKGDGVVGEDGKEVDVKPKEVEDNEKKVEIGAEPLKEAKADDEVEKAEPPVKEAVKDTATGEADGDEKMDEKAKDDEPATKPNAAPVVADEEPMSQTPDNTEDTSKA